MLHVVRWGLAPALLLVACTLEAGGSTDASGDDASALDAPALDAPVPDASVSIDAHLPADAACLGTCRVVPDGFTGPLTLLGATDPCPPELPTLEATGYGEPTDLPLACAPCGPCREQFRFTPSWTISSEPDCSPSSVAIHTGCNVLDPSAPVRSTASGGGSFTPIGCAGSPPVVLDTPPAAEPVAHLCSGHVGWCAGRHCTAAWPAGAPVCVTAPGDVACPAAFPDRHLLTPRAPTDERVCECRCHPGTVPGTTIADFSLSFYEDDACTTLVTRISGVATPCEPVEPPARSFAFAFDGSHSSCVAEPAVATGSITPSAERVTVCCGG